MWGVGHLNRMAGNIVTTNIIGVIGNNRYNPLDILRKDHDSIRAIY